jgi:hypothetical protein
MTPSEANAMIYEVTQGRPDASTILFAVFEENPNACLDMIRAIHRKQKCGAAWVRLFQKHTNPAKLLKQL